MNKKYSHNDLRTLVSEGSAEVLMEYDTWDVIYVPSGKKYFFLELSEETEPAIEIEVVYKLNMAKDDTEYDDFDLVLGELSKYGLYDIKDFDISGEGMNDMVYYYFKNKEE